ncbi:hypothetical protein SAMN05216188_13514 [Lentzea xinjiangensis]|uniref:Uncharacterized protein n=1 Tax=Lentzea xinjiangensis TaxID=402600 RepID=A0A1H9WIM6_9PSEU|nr:hypothetical protein [Lentzea xinjiangensis]SES33694.1 hypothetical protein SAMN05216188_13514 [Lentzea xinjiangensis]
MLRRLTVLPLVLLTTAAGLDALHLLTGNASAATAAWHLIAAGLLLGVAVAAAEWLDRIFGEPVGTTGRDLGVAFVLVLFGVSWALRLGQTGWEPTWAAVLAGWAGVAGVGAARFAGRRRRVVSPARA